MFLKTPLYLTALTVCLAASQACAWSLFGSKESNAKDLAAKSDRQMERADAAFDDGKYEDAKSFYEAAIKGYKKVENLVPGYEGGLPELRIRYCSTQITNIIAETSSNAPKNAPIDTIAVTVPALGQQSGDKPANADASSTASAGEYGEDGWSTGVEYVDQNGKYVNVADVNATSNAQAVTNAEAQAPAYDMRNFVHDFNEARELLEDGNLNESFEILKTLLAADPGNRSVRLMIAILRTRQGRFDEALTALEDLRGRREDLPVLLAISGAYVGKGRYMDALLALDNAEKIAPKDPSVSMNLAWLYLTMPDDEASAIKKATAYYRLAIKKGAVRDRALETRINLTKW